MDESQGETITEIHNYLNSFNKEMLPASQLASKDIAHVYVDEAGHYFYQPLDSSEIVIMDEDPKVDLKHLKKSQLSLESKYSKLNGISEESDLGNESSTETIDSNLEPLTAVSQTDDANTVLCAGGNPILTILPTSHSDAMNYVFLVEQSDDQGKEDTIYEFNEADDTVYVGKESLEEDNKKLIRILPKKKQTINAVHMCNYCNYTSSKRYLLVRHMRSHSEERPHKCSECDRGFKTLPSLQNHVNTHTGTKPHQCKCCTSQFTTSGELVRHVRYKHTYEKPHKCPDCNYASVELSKLKRHVRCHTGERPFQCPHCTYASPDTFKLKRHLRIHTGEKPYECVVCNARFTQSNSLKSHRLIHTGNKPVYACELCPTTCGRKTDLRIHVQKLHTSEKPLKCPKCAKSFPDRYTFKVHSKSHDGEKCFKCDLCACASSSVRHLESHMLIHTEQKPFRCNECDQAFRQKPLLKRHHNIFHNPSYIPPAPKEKTQICKICHRTFRHKGYLMRHMSSHEGISTDPYQKAESSPDCNKPKRQRINSISSQMNMYNGDEVVTVQGNDGNQYVFLEVIQLTDGENHVMMSGPLNCSEENSLETSNVLSPSIIVPNDQLLELEDQVNKTALKIEIPENIKKEDQKEMDSCFGFDDEEEEEASQINLQFSR